MNKNAFTDLDVARKELIARVATGISIFVRRDNDTSKNELAKEMLNGIRLMKPEYTRSMKDS